MSNSGPWSCCCCCSVADQCARAEDRSVAAVRQPQHVNTLRHFATFGSASSRCGLLHRNVTSDSLFTSGKASPKQTNQKTKTPRSHTESTTHVIRDPKPDPFGASSSSSQAHLLQTLLAPTCYLAVPPAALLTSPRALSPHTRAFSPTCFCIALCSSFSLLLFFFLLC